MPMAVVLVSGHRPDVLGVRAAHKLADLGISSMTVLGGRHAVALVLEGFAFDPSSASEAAEAVLPLGTQRQILEMQFHVAVRNRSEGGDECSLQVEK